MKAVIDTNVVLDVLQRRADFFDDSYGVLRLVAEGEIDGWFPASCVADVFYLLRRSGLNPAQARTAVSALAQVVPLCDTTAAAVAAGLLLSMSDLEDAILAATADHLGADLILTRDRADFAGSPVPAITPHEFLRRRQAEPVVPEEDQAEL